MKTRVDPTAATDALVSVVVVLRNDAEILRPFLLRTVGLLRQQYQNFEVVLVDEASTDRSLETLRSVLGEIESVRILRLARAVGAETAFNAGLESAIGDVVVTMSPRSDPPDLIPQLVERVRKGAGVVCGVDSARTGQTFRDRLGARVFYWVCKRAFEVSMIEDATHLMAMNRQALNALLKIRDKGRWMQLFIPLIGFDFELFPYTPTNNPRARRGFLASVDRALGIVVAGSLAPLRLVSWLSLAASALNGLYILYIAVVALFWSHVAEGWITLSAQHAVMFFLLFLVLAVLSEYVGRLLAESRRRPAYVVSQEITSSVPTLNATRRNVVRSSR